MGTWVGWLGDMDSLSSASRKAAPGAAFFFFYSISSEYQIGGINLPNIFEVIRV
jgi:hypothetical protein